MTITAKQGATFTTAPGGVSAGDEIAFLLSPSSTDRGFGYAINGGSPVFDTDTYADSGSNVRGPTLINSTTSAGANESEIEIDAFWADDQGTLDVAAQWSAFFDANNQPTAAMRNGDAIDGLTPDFAASGALAVWDVLSGYRGTWGDV